MSSTKLDLTFRAPTTGKPSHAASEVNEVAGEFTSRVYDAIVRGDIGNPELVVNMDETGHNQAAGRKNTLERRGTGAVRLRRFGMRQHMTSAMATSASGRQLPHLLLFAGTTKRIVPTQNEDGTPLILQHCEAMESGKRDSAFQDAKTFHKYIERILVPYRKAIIDEFNLPDSQKMLLLLDNHASHVNEEVLDHLEREHILVEFIPPNWTDVLQVT